MNHSLPLSLSRRQMLQTAACGFGGLALHDMAARVAQASSGPLAIRAAHAASRAKRVIFLFMGGGPSQMDLFDPKPLITKNHGNSVAPPVGDHQIRIGVEKYLAMGPVAPVRQRGQSGTKISDLMPQLASVADELCLLRAMHTDNKAHVPATLQFHTGSLTESLPSMGSWVSYGLGTENENLPSFISIQPPADTRMYSSSFLPAAHQGMTLHAPRSVGSDGIASYGELSIKNLHDADVKADATQQRRRIDFLQRMNDRLLNRYETDMQMEGIIESFELAFRMQTQASQLLDLSGESQETVKLYGIDQRRSDLAGRACLLARRLSEAGVRFVQVSFNFWDHHGNIQAELPNSCAATDTPVAGLIKDLKRRGLLDETLVLWSGEFGRSPWSQDLSGTSPFNKHGREHQHESFCAWMAGGGVKPGTTYGATDDFGFQGVEDKVHLHDLHATMLHLLGLDHERLTHRHAGRDFRLTDVYGNVVQEILA